MTRSTFAPSPFANSPQKLLLILFTGRNGIDSRCDWFVLFHYLRVLSQLYSSRGRVASRAVLNRRYIGNSRPRQFPVAAEPTAAAPKKKAVKANTSAKVSKVKAPKGSKPEGVTKKPTAKKPAAVKVRYFARTLSIGTMTNITRRRRRRLRQLPRRLKMLSPRRRYVSSIFCCYGQPRRVNHPCFNAYSRNITIMLYEAFRVSKKTFAPCAGVFLGFSSFLAVHFLIYFVNITCCIFRIFFKLPTTSAHPARLFTLSHELKYIFFRLPPQRSPRLRNQQRRRRPLPPRRNKSLTLSTNSPMHAQRMRKLSHQHIYNLLE